MQVMQVLHMNKGNGEYSYAQNSKLQNKILTNTKLIVEEAILQMLGSNNAMPIESIGIADLGCSSGPNTLLLIREIMDVIHAQMTDLSSSSSSSTAMEFRVFLNDLFSNDFNAVFMSLPAFYNKLKHDQRFVRPNNLFISTMPGSF